MKSNQDKTDGTYDLVNKNETFTCNNKIENLSYLYPNGHRITHQMRWLKVVQNEGFEPDMIA